METTTLRTSRRCELVDITGQVQKAIGECGLDEGVAMVFVPHTTAGVTINENADPSVVSDLLESLERMVPERADYRHAEGNSDAHCKASMMGSSVNVGVSGGRLVLGTWQGIYFCEFDGPRSRKFQVMTMPRGR